ncbi:hypothetical protein CC85DRAFT_286004 [Cutaneotrichosporon oleaginosum]|uniref:Uncharacterized protein n=1 Tax=Cutaneotrichosporon oleaginosum TaxID=879819 RepID=A0A0J0XLE8_9TREE|nr:uncharacterized protein CC85DRAFT_286004 [Cutaneotrichosporon oleaginosum]KLT41913.1 hypothetical protein CC85DRAFT_286004 [Cutaneotrichosporon oleaginosum]TXT12513.1 hypothetical protein COLE_02923 [Cutaneotrichosporon oleaginosum]
MTSAVAAATEASSIFTAASFTSHFPPVTSTTTLKPPQKPPRKPKTRGRITRGRVVPAKRITERTLVWPGLRERIAAEEVRRSQLPRRGSSSTPSSSDPSTPEDKDLPHDMSIFLESSTDDIEPNEFRIPRWDCVDFGALKREFNKKFALGGTCT